MRAMRIACTGFALVILVMAALSCSSMQQPDPPVAQIDPTVTTYHGTEFTDNYHWLRDRQDPRVIEYLTAENEYAKALTAHTEKFQKALYEEMIARIKETDLSVPVKDGDYFYYSRQEEGKQYDIYCRTKGEKGPEEILLDMNVLGEGQDYLYLGAFEISPDQNLLAYAYDTAGNEEYLVRVKDLTTGKLYDDRIEKISGNVIWANDNKTLIYTLQDETYRPYQTWRHTLGSKAKDVMLKEEPDGKYFMWVTRSRSDKYIFLGLGSKTSSEVHYMDANKPESKLRVIQPREKGVEYDVNHHGSDFYIVTNADDARNFKLMKTPVNKPSRKNWKEVIEHRKDVKLESILMFADYMVIFEREGGLPTVRIQDMKSGTVTPMTFDEPTYSFSSGENPDFNGNLFRYTYQSMVTPRSVYDYNLKDHTKELRKQTEVLGDFDPSEYKTERVFATATDGVQVPISLVYRKDKLKMDGSNPLYLYGYGSYGANMDPWFSSVRLSLLNRGFVFAIPHIRGGGEMGRYWYEDGKFLKKKNTFTDCIACGEYLVKQKWTSSDRLVISGGSAGGLLVGAVVNMRPDLAKVIVAEVPFVDIINTMMDSTIPLTVAEYEEWGNPNEKEYFDYMLSYSPYDNVEAKAYPDMLITAGLNDPRVAYWEPAKWTAKLRAMKTDDNDLILKTVMEGGHFGTSGRYSRIEEIAFEYAFILDKLGMID